MAEELELYAGLRGELSTTSRAALEDPKVVGQVMRALEGGKFPPGPAVTLLMTMLLDDSYSMSGYKQSDVIEVHNAFMEMMEGSGDGLVTMLLTRYLNGTVLNPFLPLFACRKLTEENFPTPPEHCTPLFPQTLVTLGVVLAKARQLEGMGCEVYASTMIVADGEEVPRSDEYERDKVKKLVDEMRKDGHVIAGVGVVDKTKDEDKQGEDSQRFRDTFDRMGIDPELVFTPANLDGMLAAAQQIRMASISLTQGSGSWAV